MKLLRYVGVAILASLMELSSAVGPWGGGTLAQECTVTLRPGSSIQEAIYRAASGDVICLQAGEWQENLIIEKGLTLRAAEIKEEPDVVIRSAKESWPVTLIRSEEAIEVAIVGLKITGTSGGCYQTKPEWICPDGISVGGRAQTTIEGTTISGNRAGIGMGDSSQATIQNTTISDNKEDGIVMLGSAQATIQNNKIVNNGEYGVACYQRPYFDTYWEFKGAVRGSGNEISGNKKADVCPEELKFLMTPAGGCYGPKC